MSLSSLGSSAHVSFKHQECKLTGFYAGDERQYAWRVEKGSCRGGYGESTTTCGSLFTARGVILPLASALGSFGSRKEELNLSFSLSFGLTSFARRHSFGYVPQHMVAYLPVATVPHCISWVYVTTDLYDICIGVVATLSTLSFSLSISRSLSFSFFSLSFFASLSLHVSLSLPFSPSLSISISVSLYVKRT
jgi:hypothetical protein